MECTEKTSTSQESASDVTSIQAVKPSPLVDKDCLDCHSRCITVHAPSTPNEDEVSHAVPIQPDNFKFLSYIIFILKDGESWNRKASKTKAEEMSSVRGHWLGRIDCTISLMVATVGLGNLTHFPQLAYEHGAGNFLFPLIMLTFVLGLPLFYMEVCMGQISGHGAVWGWHMAPLLKGVGLAFGVTATVMSIYFGVFNMYPLYYFSCSFQSPLPWAHCSNSWNSRHCVSLVDCDQTDSYVRMDNGTCYTLNGRMLGIWNISAYSDKKSAIFSSHEFWLEKIEGEGEDGKFGPLQLHLVICLFVVWLLCFLALVKDIRHLGKVMIFSMMLLFMVFTVLVINGALLTNSSEGVKLFLTPKWSNYVQMQMWYDVSVEVFFALILGIGVVSTMTSYSQVSDGDPFKMCVFVVTADTMVSIATGLVFFAHMASTAYRYRQPIKKLTDIAGLEAAYVIYPESISQSKVGPFLSIVFFVAFSGLGMTSEIAVVQVLKTALFDKFPGLHKRRVVVLLVLCTAGFLACLPFTVKGGNRWNDVLFRRVGAFCILLNGLMEVIVMAWIYGVNNFCHRIEVTTGRKLSVYWKVCWKYIIPIYLAALLLWTLSEILVKTRMDVGVVVLCAIPLVCVLTTMLFQLVRAPRNLPLRQKFSELLAPDGVWKTFSGESTSIPGKSKDTVNTLPPIESNEVSEGKSNGTEPVDSVNTRHTLSDFRGFSVFTKLPKTDETFSLPGTVLPHT